MDRPLVAVVLAGGTGTRLYPASRSHRPKQFLSLGGPGEADPDDDRSLLRRTADRADFADETVVVTGERFADRVREHAPDADVLVEPEPKDTGPALVYAAHHVRERVGDCVLVCLPSDHHVKGAFEPTMRTAAGVAADTGGLVTVGVEPDRPATGYGYVEPGEDRGEYATVERFREKPDAATAADLVARGCYWNAGMFAWTPDALLDAARDSDLAPLVAALDSGDPDGGFDAAPAVSVDYAVMEHADDAYVVPAGFDWDDLGSWDALDRVLDGDHSDDGNTVVGDALAIDASGNVIASDDKHVSVVGVNDLVVVAYDDRVLVVPKDDAQRVREVVAALRGDGRF
jgi:mannose-1-phosphate guanylyltransferase